ncbi:NmrA family transcriptional regulator [Actinomycetospora sp. NBRC 106375]|uniref:NmrA family NAD(P)-binding protein n=1 Tax=Actinomycetospora sp. NBRC 106375 TaxID=3032207 RepID=UPI0024A58C47|nr:NAD(P)H-binding protein [Actinomycetospora sp. NBRC 106375]GLZ46389.1 NmrA family transcriptional regulator [Actinomycetospora sp. NBRC 106375]
MTIAITTPRGHVGSHVLPRLVQSGVRPRVLLRDPATLDPTWREHVDAVACDQDDADAVVAATRGVEALLWISPTQHTGDPVATHARLGGHVARAVRENGIARTVFQSSIGAEKRHGAGEIDGLARVEEALDATGAPVLHLRAGYFFTNLEFEIEALRAGVLRTAMPLDAPMPWADPRDIAEVAAGRLLAPWARGGVQAVHGPRHLCFAEVAEVLTTALGRPVRAERLTDDELRAGLRSAGLGDAAVEAIVGMSAGLREDFVPEQPRSALTTTPSTLEGWAHAHLRPLVDG